MSDMQGTPINDMCGEQVQASDPVMPTLGDTATGFALEANAQSVLERVMRLAFVEAALLAVRIADDPAIRLEALLLCNWMPQLRLAQAAR